MRGIQDSRILVVDDDDVMRQIVTLFLEDEGAEVRTAKNGLDGLDKLDEVGADLIIVDVMMPLMDGFEFAKTVKSRNETREIPVILLTSLSDREARLRGLACGAEDFLSKPVDRVELVMRARNLLRLKAANDALSDRANVLEKTVRDRTQEVRETRLDLIRCLAAAMDCRDNETGMHITRLSKYSEKIAQVMELGAEREDLILHASPLHDIGKVGIPDAVLQKPGVLTESEWQVMRTHPELGHKVLEMGQPSDLIECAKSIALHHHERWDGGGYPYGISGEDIPLAARIVAVADVYDALTSRRPYKEPWEKDRVRDYVKQESGKHFDPKVVSAFFEVASEIDCISVQLADQ